MPLDATGCHAAWCNLGGGVTAIHDAVCECLHVAGKAAGFKSLREQVIPLLADAKRQEPRLDVEVWGNIGSADRLLDVTVCFPWAARYETSPTAAPATA